MRLVAAYVALAAALLVSPGVRAQGVRPITWRLAFPGPPMANNLREGLKPWAEDVMRASGGTLKIQIYPGGVLAKIPQVYDRLLRGVFEIGYTTQDNYRGVFPKSQVVGLPFLINDIRKGAVAFWNLYADGIISDEYAKVKPVAFYEFPNDNLHTRKPIKRMEDLDGLKIGTQGVVNSRLMEALGGTPITVTTTENYTALERDLIQGVEMGFAGFTSFKLQEVTNYHLLVALGAPPGFTFVNKQAYERLPEKAKAAIDKYSGESFSARMGRALYHTAEMQFKTVKGLPGHTIYKLDPKELARWKEKARPIEDAWLATVPDGHKVLAAFKEELIKAGDRSE